LPLWRLRHLRAWSTIGATAPSSLEKVNLLLQVLLEGQEGANRVDLALVRVGDCVHAAAAIPQLNLVASASGEVDVQVTLEGQRLDTIYFAVVGRHYAHLHIFVLRLGHLHLDARLVALLVAQRLIFTTLLIIVFCLLLRPRRKA